MIPIPIPLKVTGTSFMVFHSVCPSNFLCLLCSFFSFIIDIVLFVLSQCFLFPLFLCISWCGGNVLLVMFQFTFKSLDCIGWIEWMLLLLSLLHRIDFVDVLLLMPIPYSFWATFQSVIINQNFLFASWLSIVTISSSWWNSWRFFAVGQLIHLLFQGLTLKTVLLAISLIQLNLLMQS